MKVVINRYDKSRQFIYIDYQRINNVNDKKLAVIEYGVIKCDNADDFKEAYVNCFKSVEFGDPSQPV